MYKYRMKEKRKYIKPVMTRIVIDNTISLVMMSRPDHPPHPEHPPKQPKPKGAFDSPFGDSNFK